jgi:exosome complex component RRP4
LIFGSGHGTFVEDEQVIASVAGTVERVNKLVSVKPVKSRYVLAREFFQGSSRDIHRYTPEVGDLVVGRITEVCPNVFRCIHIPSTTSHTGPK